MPGSVIFLDDGGVMNDNHRRGPQWQRLVGEFFPPVLGGTPAAWREANRRVITELLTPEDWESRLQAATDYAAFDRAYHLDWLRGMCALVGVPAPPEEECLELARRANASIPRQVRADFPGAVDAIRRLHARGHALHTASGESSSDLDGYLTGMGVRPCFGHLYGPDLVGVFKNGPEYYERIFVDACVHPSDALVVDDSPAAVRWALEAGARAVLVSAAPHPDLATVPRIARLADLPAMIAHLD